MPIRGLTDRNASFPEIGAVRKGDRGGKNGAPRDLAYFLIQLDEREKKAAELLKTKYGEQPAEINILFPFDDVDRNFECWLEAYLAGALVYRSDGERVLYELDHTTGQRVVVNGEPYRAHRANPLGFYTNQKDEREPINAKPTGRMKVIIPELERLCYLTVHTTSLHDVVNLTAQLRALYTIHGRLAGIPLKLRRRPVKISMPGDNGKRVRRAKWLLSVEADPEWVAAKLAQMRRAALPDADVAGLLAPPEESGLQPEARLPGPTWGDYGDDDEDDVVEAEPAPIDLTDKGAVAAPSISTSNGNGHSQRPAASGKQAVIKCGQAVFNRLAAGVADLHEKYRNAKGQPDNAHLLYTLAALGYPTLTSDNVETAFDALHRHAAGKITLEDAVPF